MAYIIEQKVKNRIYLYEVKSFWDKEKKQSRQKRKYLGPKERIYKKRKSKNTNSIDTVNIKTSNIVSKSYGDTFLAKKIQNELGLTELLKKHFKEDYKEILSLSNYLFQESLPSYLFPYWHEEHDLEGIKKLNSSLLSSLYERIGKKELSRLEFLKDWGNHIKPTSGIYYDITSVSSYSNNNENIEWGYNRDNEYLPQINIGFTYCSKSSLPLSYNVHSGSIVDVSTLKNTIKLFNLFCLKNLFFILDRGFWSVSNIKEMYEQKMSFIQPLSFNLKKAKDLLLKHKSTIFNPEKAFKYKEELLYHTQDEIKFDNIKLQAHIFFNEKRSIDYKHYLYKIILDIEAKFKIFKNKEECEKYIEDNIQSKYKKYFKVQEGYIIRNNEFIENDIFKAGMMIFAVNGKEELSNVEIFSNYRNRNKIEKEIDMLKNQIDNKRIRAHNKDTANGRLFVKFLALIQHSKIMHVIKNNDKLKKYSLKEVISELKKLKIICFDRDNKFLSELTKKQKIIFKAFNIHLRQLQPSY